MADVTTPDRILDAVLGVVSTRGLARMSLEDVADRARVSRQTVYRHFANRERLIEEAILREERLLIDQMLRAAGGQTALQGAIEVAVRTALALARDHAVLSRLLDREPVALLPYLLLGRGPVISAAEPAVAELVHAHRPTVSPSRLRLVADMATRLLVSYVVSPHDDIPDDVLARELGATVVALIDR